MTVVIVGTGVAGATVASALRAKGYTDSVVLVGDEPHLPYQRPQLSKDHLQKGGEPLLLRPARYWEDQGIDLIRSRRVVAIDRAASTVELNDGRPVRYDHLVLATGARNREIPGLTSGLSLRRFDESMTLRDRLLAPNCRIVIVGAGFIGLEVAAVARSLGAEVTVVEALDRVMARAVSPPMSRWFEERHAEAGIRILRSTRVERLTPHEVVLDSGTRIQADTVLVATGVVPNVEIAEAAGLAVADGVVVDEYLRTADPSISAIGDCARFRGPRGALRLESVQNATDQARTVAARIAGESAPYGAIPWFWSDQLSHKLQIAGVAPPDAVPVLRGDTSEGRFSVGLFVGRRLVAVESVGRPADHIAARKWLASGSAAPAVLPADFADVRVPISGEL